jgi:hypothetical protein
VCALLHLCDSILLRFSNIVDRLQTTAEKILRDFAKVVVDSIEDKSSPESTQSSSIETSETRRESGTSPLSVQLKNRPLSERIGWIYVVSILAISGYCEQLY